MNSEFKMALIKSISIIFCILLAVNAEFIEIKGKTGGAFRYKPRPESEKNAVQFELVGRDDTPRLHGWLGLNFPATLEPWTSFDCPPNYSLCAEWGDYAQLTIQETTPGDCFRMEWTSNYAREIEDCFELEEGVHWYGGGEMYTQIWPIETNPRLETPYVPSDSMSDHDTSFGGVIERYFLLSNGAAAVIDADVPLFFSLNSTHANKVCFKSKDQHPYTKRSPLTLSYEWCTASDVKAAHQLTHSKHFSKPTGIPDEGMLTKPIWCTWAEFKMDVNQSLVLDYARQVVNHGFGNSSHVELDDDWEECYGEESFNPVKFPNPKEMVDEIRALGMRTTAWIHPFINYDCPRFNEAVEKGYLVKDAKDRFGITWWWQGQFNGVIDMTNEEAVEWWTSRLENLQRETGIDSYKFDAGEYNWLPPSFVFRNDDHTTWPLVYTHKYIEACAKFGGLIEIRAGFQNQHQPIFMRMLDRDSRWTYDNGLRSIIPSLFHIGISGYLFVLPDMIGGNNYGQEDITQEFYVRWMQHNVLMPSLQFSISPWKVGRTDGEKAETVRLCLEVLELREKYSGHIISAARQAVVDGSPVNRPLWWVDPTDSETFTIDDEYMLGDELLVAPVLNEGQVSRDIYLPRGTWVAETDGAVHTGPIWLRNYPAPLDVVPVFGKSA